MLRDVGFPGNADHIRASADFLLTRMLAQHGAITVAFHPAIDDALQAELSSRTDTNRLSVRKLAFTAGEAGEFSSPLLMDGDKPEPPGDPAPILLVLKHSFYGLSRERSAALLAAVPERVETVLIIDQTDGFDQPQSAVLSLLDNGARPYEAECHDFGNLLNAAGFHEGYSVDLPDPVKSLSGLVLATRHDPITPEALVEHCRDAAESMRLQRRATVNAQRKARISTIKAPRRLIIEPSSQCNFMCPKCVYPIMERAKGLIDIPKLEAFLDAWVRDVGTFESVDLTGSGDVLVNRQLPEIIRLFSSKMPEAKLTATTNLALLNDKTAESLLDAGLRYWQVSFDSAEEEEFHRFTKSKKFHTVVANIKLLYAKMQARTDGPFDLTIVAHRPFDEHYESGMKAIRDLLRGHCHAISCTPYQSLNGRIAGEIYRASEKEFYSREVMPIVCNYLWDDLVVVHTGDVRLCCSDMFDSKVNFGNIFRDAPQALIENMDRQLYQKHMMAGEVDQLYLCKDCHAPFAPV